MYYTLLSAANDCGTFGGSKSRSSSTLIRQVSSNNTIVPNYLAIDAHSQTAVSLNKATFEGVYVMV